MAMLDVTMVRESLLYTEQLAPFFQIECTLCSTITVMLVGSGNTDTSADTEDTTSLSPTSTKENGMIKPRGNSRYATVKDQVSSFSFHFFPQLKMSWFIYMEISNGNSRSGGSDEATANLVMTELLDLLASAVPVDTAAGKCKATHLFFGDVVRLFPFPKKPSPVSSSKKLISIQRCRRLWGSFGLASYSTLNAIYWIMNLLCSSDRVNSVNSLSVHPPPHPTKKKQAFKVTLWCWM